MKRELPEIPYEVNDEEFEKLVQESFYHLDANMTMVSEASEKASFYNKMRLMTANKKRQIAKEVAFNWGLMKSEWSSALNRSSVKSVTEKKETAVGDKEYLKRHYEHAESEATYERLQDLMKTYTDAHIQFRAMSKEERM